MFESIPQFLLWIGTPAAGIAVLSFLNERWGWFQEQPPKTKMAISWAIALVLPQVSLILLNEVDPAFWVRVNPYFYALLTGLSVIWSEAFHYIDITL